MMKKNGFKIKRVKTGNPEDVPLLPIPEAIIEKYRYLEFRMSEAEFEKAGFE